MKHINLIIIFITVLILLFGIVYEESLHRLQYPYAEYFIFIFAYLLVGRKVVLSAVKNIFKGKIFDENFLMTIATLGAIAIHQLPEAVAVMLFFNIGEFLQDLAVDRSMDSIESLLKIKPDNARIIFNGEPKDISPDEVKKGDEIIVKPGEKIPLDGIIISGASQVDTYMLTGESVPKYVSVNDEVLAGMINSGGVLNIRVTKLFSETSLSKIVEYTENARLKKSESEKFITTFARYYSPIVVCIAACVGLLPPLIFHGELFSVWIYRALVSLVISCPCALVISIPLTYFGGLGAASRHGVLIKGSNYIDMLAKADKIIFDKTGTLTRGNFKVIDVIPSNNFSKKEVVEYAARAESHSNHPIARSISEYYGKIDNNSLSEYEEFPGLGIKAKINQKTIHAGNYVFLKNSGIKFDEVRKSGTLLYIASDFVYAGCIIIADEIKEDSKSAVNELKNMGINFISMFTGDNREIAEDTAHQLGIENYRAELLPEQKFEAFEEVEKDTMYKGRTVFVGDGINDAPVLARADVGIAMGGLGSDVAIDNADIVIMCDRLIKVPYAIKISRKTREIVWQNIFLALLVKVFFILFGSAGLVTMWEAVFADVGVTILVVFNSLRLLKIKL